MPDIVKIGFIGVFGVLLALQFKSHKPEFALCIGIVCSVLIFAFCIDRIRSMILLYDRLQGYLGDAHYYLSILLKVVGITYICEFCSGICKDAGYGTVAGQIEIMGKVTVLLSGLPILLAVIEQIYSLI